MVSRRKLILELATILDQLRPFKIRGASDYAELLVADALKGKREASGVNKGFDIVTPGYGRVEVKCRRLPPDGRLEQRIEIGSTKRDGFDHLAIVIFYPDFSVKGAILVPYKTIWSVVTTQRYNRIGYGAAFGLPGTIDITECVAVAAET